MMAASADAASSPAMVEDIDAASSSMMMDVDTAAAGASAGAHHDEESFDCRYCAKFLGIRKSLNKHQRGIHMQKFHVLRAEVLYPGDTVSTVITRDHGQAWHCDRCGKSVWRPCNAQNHANSCLGRFSVVPPTSVVSVTRRSSSSGNSGGAAFKDKRFSRSVIAGRIRGGRERAAALEEEEAAAAAAPAAESNQGDERLVKRAKVSTRTSARAKKTSDAIAANTNTTGPTSSSGSGGGGIATTASAGKRSPPVEKTRVSKRQQQQQSDDNIEEEDEPRDSPKPVLHHMHGLLIPAWKEYVSPPDAHMNDSDVFDTETAPDHSGVGDDQHHHRRPRTWRAEVLRDFDRSAWLDDFGLTAAAAAAEDDVTMAEDDVDEMSSDMIEHGVVEDGEVVVPMDVGGYEDPSELVCDMCLRLYGQRIVFDTYSKRTVHRTKMHVLSIKVTNWKGEVVKLTREHGGMFKASCGFQSVWSRSMMLHVKRCHAVSCVQRSVFDVFQQQQQQHFVPQPPVTASTHQPQRSQSETQRLEQQPEMSEPQPETAVPLQHPSPTKRPRNNNGQRPDQDLDALEACRDCKVHMNRHFVMSRRQKAAHHSKLHQMFCTLRFPNNEMVTFNRNVHGGVFSCFCGYPCTLAMQLRNHISRCRANETHPGPFPNVRRGVEAVEEDAEGVVVNPGAEASASLKSLPVEKFVGAYLREHSEEQRRLSLATAAPPEQRAEGQRSSSRGLSAHAMPRIGVFNPSTEATGVKSLPVERFVGAYLRDHATAQNGAPVYRPIQPRQSS